MHLLLEHSKSGGGRLKLKNGLFHQKPGGIGLWHDTDLAFDIGVNFEGFCGAEIVAIFLVPFLVSGRKYFFRVLADTLAMPEFQNKIRPFLPAVLADRT